MLEYPEIGWTRLEEAIIGWNMLALAGIGWDRLDWLRIDKNEW